MARVADLLHRLSDERAAWRVGLLEINLPATLYRDEEEREDAAIARALRNGRLVEAVKRLRMRSGFLTLVEARDEAERRARELDLRVEGEEADATTGLDRYPPAFRRRFLAEIQARIRQAGVSDAEELVRLLDVNLAPILSTREDLVVQAVREGRMIAAARRWRERNGGTKADAEAAVARLRAELSA